VATTSGNASVTKDNYSYKLQPLLLKGLFLFKTFLKNMKRFNVRVYGLYLEANMIMVCEEMIHGQQIIKFPGGGLEYGEGTIEGLKREFMEEMQIEIEILSHYYTTDYFQPSAYDDSQVISIYYMIRPLKSLILPLKNEREHFYFAEINYDLLNTMSLPIDKLVIRKMLKYI
jgi:8-oxo-dGTP diphosphatase